MYWVVMMVVCGRIKCVNKNGKIAKQDKCIFAKIAEMRDNQIQALIVALSMILFFNIFLNHYLPASECTTGEVRKGIYEETGYQLDLTQQNKSWNRTRRKKIIFCDYPKKYYSGHRCIVFP